MNDKQEELTLPEVIKYMQRDPDRYVLLETVHADTNNKLVYLPSDPTKMQILGHVSTKTKTILVQGLSYDRTGAFLEPAGKLTDTLVVYKLREEYR